MSKKQPEKRWKIIINNGSYDDEEDGLWYFDPGYRFVVQLQEDLSKEEIKKRKHADPWFQLDARTVFGFMLQAAETCCGFPQIGGFDVGTDKMPDEAIPMVVKAFRSWMGDGKGNTAELKNKGYYCGYIPDTDEYDQVRKVFSASGFVPGIRLKSNHGDYTNTRWEWFDGKKVKCPLKDEYLEGIMKRLRKNEKALSALPI